MIPFTWRIQYTHYPLHRHIVHTMGVFTRAQSGFTIAPCRWIPWKWPPYYCRLGSRHVLAAPSIRIIIKSARICSEDAPYANMHLKRIIVSAVSLGTVYAYVADIARRDSCECGSVDQCDSGYCCGGIARSNLWVHSWDTEPNAKSLDCCGRGSLVPSIQLTL